MNNLAGHLVKYGKHRTRRSFSRIKEVIGLPNLIEVQTLSYKNFLDEGLANVFKEMFPIDNFAGTMELEFVGYEMKTPKYTVEEARAHDANYSAPIYVTFRLVNKETGETTPKKFAVQLLATQKLNNGALKKELVDITIEEKEVQKYQSNIGKDMEINCKLYSKSAISLTAV